MNTRKNFSKRIGSFMLAVLLTLSSMIFQTPTAHAANERTPVEVSSYEELVAAMDEAADREMILLNGAIFLPADCTLGDPDKRITLLRQNPDDGLVVDYNENTQPTIIQNLVFDGNGISSNSALLKAHYGALISNCAFVNSKGGGIDYQDTRSELTVINSTFDNNGKTGIAGHISIAGDWITANLENCTFTNGSGDMSGAIHVGRNATCNIKSCVITGNTATYNGGGIGGYLSTVNIENSKIYKNIAPRGADIAVGNVTVNSDLSALTALYEEDGLKPLGWAYDYGILTESENISATDIDLVCLKMTFEEEPAVVEPTVIYEPVYITKTKTVEKIVEVAPKEEPKEPVTLKCNQLVLDTSAMAYLQGYSDGIIGTNDLVTRGQTAQILYRLVTPETLALLSGDPCSFSDVQSGDWFYTAVAAMTEARVISGYSDGTFKPGNNVTWAEMITLLYRFTDYTPDCHIITRHWSKDAINTAIELKWIDYTDQFTPDSPVTRGEMIDFINAVFAWAKAE